MDDKRNWRDANIPQWVKNSIAKEIGQWELTVALSWPTEPKPEPLPFRWVEYDRTIGDPVEGHYWNPHWGGGRGFIQELHIKQNNGMHGPDWKTWAFSKNGASWNTSPTRGWLFDNERDARLWLLWEGCEAFAKELMLLRRGVR